MPEAFSIATTSALDPEEKSRLAAAASRLDAVLNDAERWFSLAQSPVRGSPVDRAFEADLRDPYDLGGLLLFSAQDHLRAIRIILEAGPLPSYALYTLARAAAEADVRAQHLLAPKVTETTRLGRALNERLDSLNEQHKVLPPTGRGHTGERIAHLEARAAANGIKTIRSLLKDGSAGPIVGFGEAVRSDFDLFRMYFPEGSNIVRFLSGYVHSKPWVQLSRENAKPSERPGVSLHSTELNVAKFSDLLRAIVALHGLNFVQWLRLAGHKTNGRRG